MPLEFTDELLSAYLDGELSPAERAQVESQLATDPQARQLVDELRALSGAVRDLPRHTVSSRFSQRVVQAALAAKANQNREVTPASVAGAPLSFSPNKVRRGRRLPVVLAGAAAVAAAVAMMVWFANRPAPGPGGGMVVAVPGITDPSIADPAVTPGPADASAVEAALARLRLAIPQEGEGLVLRLSISRGQTTSEAIHEAIDAALAAAGLEFRLPEDDTTGAHRFASEYQNKLAEKVAGQSAAATLAAADAIFVTAPLDKLEKAIAALASGPKSPLEISPLMSGRIVMESGSEGENASTGQSKPKYFAQRLPVQPFRLEKGGSPLAEITPPAAALDPAKTVRVLILVEP